MKTQVTITMDPEILAQLKVFAKRCGTSMSSLLNMSAAKMVETQSFEIDLSAPLTPEEESSRERAMADLKAGKNWYTLEELDKELTVS